MANYLYGAYGLLGDTVIQSADKSGTVLVVIGTAPVHLLRGNKPIHTPVAISNMTEARQYLGYAADWSKYTLCEVMAAHFANAKGNIGPVYMVNVADPDKATRTKNEKMLSFIKGTATLEGSDIVLDSFALADKAEGVDYTVSHQNGVTTVSMIGDRSTSDIAASFETITYAVGADDVIGGEEASGAVRGLAAVSLIYPKFGVYPDVISAPGFSSMPSVRNAMLDISQQINDHWNTWILTDIPLADNGAEIATISDAKAWKASNGYASMFEKTCWPKAIGTDGKVYHLSSLWGVELLRTDAANNNVPMETASNKTVPVRAQYFGEHAENPGFDRKKSHALTKAGISTCIFEGGDWVLWGDSTSQYTFGADNDVRAIFDNNIRMLLYLTNEFQVRYGSSIDKTVSRTRIDAILNREQARLDALKAQGAFLGAPQVRFLAESNSDDEMMQGRFYFDFDVTAAPSMKAIVATVNFTSAGYSALIEEVS